MDEVTPAPANISISDAVKLGAVDAEFFNRTFFPKTFRQPSPPMHKEIDLVLDSPQHRYVNLQCFRGSAKTTKLRAFLARRVAYRMSRTALFIGGSETSASRSILWLRNQIERNKLFASTFGLQPGKKWTDTELEIFSTITGTSTWILGTGMTSNLRGINFDDYRPDLIVCDDPLTDENVLTQESRAKTVDLLLGAVAKSLTPRSEEPNGKLALLQTPLHPDDASMQAAKSELWKTLRFPCWTRETEDLPVEQQISSWEERFSTEELRQEKRHHYNIGKGAVFAREQEVRLVSSEQSVFKPGLINIYTELPKGFATTVLAIDPVPPASDREIEKNLVGKDFEVISIWSRIQRGYYLREYVMSRGHTPAWTLAKTFELALKYNISSIAVETVAYQRTLKWLLEQEMKRRGRFYSIVEDKGGNKSKYQKIVDTYSSILQYGLLYVHDTHTEFLEAFSQYPRVQHDDLLDSGAIGLRALINPTLELSDSDYTVDESDYEPLKIRRGCP